MRGHGVILLPVVLCVLGCGQTQDRVAGGGSDQPNKIEASGRVLTDSGLPASGAKVVSYTGEWNPTYSNAAGKPYDSSQTDSTGRWALRIPESGLWYVTATKPGYRAVSLPGQNEMRLSAEAQISGTLTRPKGLVVESVWLGGTDQPLSFKCYNDSFCTFYRTTLPGPVRIWAKVSWATGSDTLLLAERTFVPGFNASLDLLPDTGNVLLVSADAKPMRSALRGLDYNTRDLETGKWFNSTDSLWGGNSILQPNGFPDTDSALKDGMFGRYFSWKMWLGDPLFITNGKVIPPWVGVGVRLSNRDLDWSGVKSIQLRVKGGGAGDAKIWLQLNSTEVDRVGGNGQFRTQINLPAGWSSINIPVTAFAPVPGSKADSLKYSWDRIKHSIHDIAFFAGSQNLTFELQEVRALGSRLRNW